MQRNLRLLFLFLAMCVVTINVAADVPYGLTTRAPIGPFLNSALPPAASDSSAGWEAVPAFPNLTFEDPTFLVPQPGTNRLYVGTRQGIVWFFTNNPSTSVKTQFLNLTNRNQGYDDCGMLGMAFHPEFGQPTSTNRSYVYVWYQYTPTPTNPSPARPSWTTPTYNRLSRFTVPDGSLIADPNSEQVLINQFDRHLWHNGGGMFFGSDGFLYVSNGDEGDADDHYGNGQKLNKGLFSGVLRIDVNKDPGKSHPIRRQPIGATPPAGWPPTYSTNYYVPNDNPFTNPDGSILEEFFAIGVRSPHRMTYDPPTGQIWLGDVGDGNREEVSLIVKGGNYQWPYFEGFSPGPVPAPNPIIGIDTPPVYDYRHSDINGNFTGNSCVIGGYVYRGSQHAAELAGKYIFGDNVSGRIWSLTYNGTNTPVVTQLCNMPGAGYDGLCSFGLDQNNELLMCQMGPTGKIWKLARNGATIAPPPTLLSQTGVFTNLSILAPTSGVIPYDVNSPLWSDAAVKSRWVAVPNDGIQPISVEEQVGFSPTGEWTFPVGTVFIKHFELPINDLNPSIRKRLETRLLIHSTNGNYYGFTYKWRSDNSDADLLTNSLNENIVITGASGSRTQTWYYPSQQDCLICHNPNANFVLGVKTRQLNGLLTYPGGITDNQLRAWNHIGMFNQTLNETNITNYAHTVRVSDTNAPLDVRVRSYLDANCAHCHRPNGGVQANFDAVFDTPLANQNIVNGTVGNTLGIVGACVVKPSDLSKSVMNLRMNSLGSIKMPPMAKNVIDTQAVATLQEWINSLVSPSVTAQPQDQIAAAGAPATFTVSATGSGVLNYQWRRNGVNISGATSSIYQIAVVQPNHAGTYQVTISNAAGSVTSSNCSLTVTGPPIITTQPQDQSVAVGADVIFSVASSGTTPLTYQWRLNGTNINGATSSTYSLNNVLVTDSGIYSVLITNLLGSALSSNAFLTVNLPATITWSNQDIGDVNLPGGVLYTNGNILISGTGADIWGEADALNFLYQPFFGDGSIVAQVLSIEDTDAWAKAGVMFRNTLDPGSANAFMAITKENGATFQYRLVSGEGSDAFGGGASISAPYWVKLVRNGNNFSGYVSGFGTNWVFVGDLDIDMTNQIYVGLAVTAHNNGLLNTSTFNSVEFMQSIALQPQSQTVNQGNNATFTVLADGAPLDYQWRYNGSNIFGAKGSSYTVFGAQPANSGAYSVVISNLAGVLISSNATLTVNPALPPVIASQPTSQSVNQNGNATFTVSASGTAPLRYQWKHDSVSILGATDASYSISNVQSSDAGNYSVVVSNIAGSATSSNASLVINIPPAITNQPQNQIVNLGGGFSFTITATGTVPLSYQWFLDSTAIPGATAATYAKASTLLADQGAYAVVITNIAGSITSSVVTLTLNVSPTITLQPQSVSTNQGANATFMVNASGTQPLSYQWLFAGNSIAGATDSVYTRTNVQTSDEGAYSVVITNIAGVITSSSASLTVNLPPHITSQPESLFVAAGSNVTFTVIANGTSPLAYQWSLNGTNIADATASSYTRVAVGIGDQGNYTVTITNIAGTATSSSASLTVNTAPILTFISSQEINEGADLVITNSAFDQDVPMNVLTFSLGTNSPAGVSINPTNGVLTWTPTEAQGPSTNIIEVIVTDDGIPSLSDSKSFEVVVHEVNLQPSLAAIADQTIDEGATLIVTNFAIDIDIPANALTFSLGTNAPAGASINPTNGVFTWTPTESQGPSTNVIEVIVSDNGAPNLMDSKSFSIVVRELNNAPSLAAITDQSIDEGSNLIITNIATDIDLPANNLTFSLDINAPVGAAINPTNGVFTWAPTEAQGPSTNVIQVIISDDGEPTLTDSKSFTVVVNDVNIAPSLAAIADQSIEEGSTLTITNFATDLDLPVNTLTFSLSTNAPAGATINPTNGVFSWTPTEAQGPGTNIIEIIVSDDGTPSLTDSKNFIVVVHELNSSPSLIEIADQTIEEGTTLTITNLATDADLPANTLTFSLGTNAPSGAVINPTNGVFTWTPAEDQGPSTNLVEVIVSDNRTPNLTDLKSFIVMVHELNSAPSLAEIADQSIAEGSTLIITNIATDIDLPGNTLTFSLGTNAPAGATINPTNGIFAWTPTEAQGPSTNIIEVLVSDDGVPSLTDLKSFTIVVNEENSSPSLTAITDQSINEGSTLTITNSATDPDLPANTLTFSLSTNAPAGATINPTNGIFVWTPTEAQGPSTNIIEIIVSDDGVPSLADSKSFTVVVNEVNNAPSLAEIPEQSIDEGYLLTITNLATDIDIPANALTFTLGTNAPAGATINPTNGLVTWTPTEAQGPSTNIIEVIVSDDGAPNLNGSKFFTIVVNEVNSAPSLTEIADQTVDESNTLSITNLAADADLPANALTFSLGTNAPAGATINPTNGVFTWTPTEVQGPSTNIIEVIVSDDGVPNLDNIKSFTVIVNELNSAPSLAEIADQIIEEGTTLTITNLATDADLPANILIFSLSTNAPAGATINPTNGVFTWTPTEAQGPGTNIIEVIVSDDGTPNLTDSKTFTVVVNEVNSSPSLAEVANQTVDEGTTIIITNTATDIDLPVNTLTFSLGTNAPAGATIDPNNGVFSWTPTEAQGPSTNIIEVIVSDEGSPNLSDTKTFTLFVNEVNEAPVINPIPPRIVHENGQVNFAVSASDVDFPANILNFSLDTNAPTGALINTTNGVFSWTPTSDQLGTNIFTIQVADDGFPSLHDSTTVSIVVVLAPKIQSIALSEGTISLQWSAIPGQEYKVQYKTNLADAVWTDLSNAITAIDSTVGISDQTSASSQRFYRIILVP